MQDHGFMNRSKLFHLKPLPPNEIDVSIQSGASELENPAYERYWHGCQI